MLREASPFVRGIKFTHIPFYRHFLSSPYRAAQRPFTAAVYRNAIFLFARPQVDQRLMHPLAEIRIRHQAAYQTWSSVG